MQMTSCTRTMLPARSNFVAHGADNASQFQEILAGYRNKSNNIDDIFDANDGSACGDDFGTPSRMIHPIARKSSACEQSLLSVFDVCVISDEEQLCEILKRGVTRGALNKKDAKTGRVRSFICRGETRNLEECQRACIEC